MKCSYISSVARAEDQFLKTAAFQWWWMTIPCTNNRVVSLEVFVGKSHQARVIAIFYAPHGRSRAVIEDGYTMLLEGDELHGRDPTNLDRRFRLSCMGFEFRTKELEGSLKFSSHAAWSVGVADSWLPRRLNAVPFVWTVPGAQCSFRGSILERETGEVYAADVNLFGYRDRNFGRSYTPSWRWAAAPSLLEFPYRSEYDAFSLSQLLEVARRETREMRPSAGDAFIVGGQAPQILRKHRHSIVLLWLRGRKVVFDGFEPGKDWGYQDSTATSCGRRLFFSMLLRRGDLTVSCAFSVPFSSAIRYPIVDGDFRAVYNDPSKKEDQLWQSGLARGVVLVTKSGRPPQAFYAPFAGLEVGDLSAPKWISRP